MIPRGKSAVGIVVCLLAGCGGGGGGQSADEKQVRATVNEALTTKDEGACARLLEPVFVEQAALGIGAEAVASCRSGQIAVGAKSVVIDDVTVSGASADADIRSKGGVLPFKTATLGLRKSAGHWKVARLKAAELDRSALARVMKEQLTGPGESIATATVNCAVRELEKSPDSEIESAFVKPDPRPVLIPLVVCIAKDGLASEGVAQPIVACFARHLRAELTTGTLGRKLENGKADANLLSSSDGEALGRRAAKACVQSPA